MIEIAIQPQRKPGSIPSAVERAAAHEGLTLALKGTLAQYPGCVHWHYKKSRERGTLEITWWPQEERLWFKVAANRHAAWIDETVPRLKQTIESKL